MKVTISVIKADVGGIGGHTRPSDGLLNSVKKTVKNAGDLLLDHYIGYCGDDIHIVMTHTKGVDNNEIHKLAWNAFEQATEVAKQEGLYGAGQDLLKDSFSGNVKGMGPGVAEIEFEERPNEAAKEKGEKLVKSVGYKLENVPIIPVSGWMGDNLVKKSENMPWWTGKTLLETFDDFTLPDKPIGKPLRIPIQDVYSITGVGTVPVGRVETGKMKANDKIIVMPSGAVGEIKSIETHHTQMESAEAGDNIGFNLRGIEKKDIKRGDVLGHPDNPPNVAKEFLAQIIIIHHPTALAPGYTPVMHAHTAQVAATITEFVSKINPATGAEDEKGPKFLKVGDSAIVKIRPVRPTPIETFKDFPEMGRFALRDMGATIAAGIVKEITEKYTS